MNTKPSFKLNFLFCTLLAVAVMAGLDACGYAQERMTLYGHADQVSGVAYSPDGKKLASVGSDKTLRMWNPQTGQAMFVVQNKHTGIVTSVAYSPDGKSVISGSTDKTARTWDAANGKDLQTFKGHTDAILAVAFSADSKMIATASADSSVKIWDASNGTELKTLNGHTKAASAVAFSPDGKWIATGSDDKSVRIWEVESGKEKFKLAGPAGHLEIVHALAFSPDSEYLASASRDATIKLIKTDTGKEVKVFDKVFKESVNAVTFAPDGKTLIACGDFVAKSIDIAAGKEKTVFRSSLPPQQQKDFWHIAVSSDGKFIAAACQDNIVRIFDVR